MVHQITQLRITLQKSSGSTSGAHGEGQERWLAEEKQLLKSREECRVMVVCEVAGISGGINTGKSVNERRAEVGQP